MHIDRVRERQTSELTPRTLLLPFLVAALGACASNPRPANPQTLVDRYEQYHIAGSQGQERDWAIRRESARPERIQMGVNEIQARLNVIDSTFLANYQLAQLVAQYAGSFEAHDYDQSDVIRDRALSIIEAHLHQQLAQMRTLSNDEVDTRFRVVRQDIQAADREIGDCMTEYQGLENRIFMSIPFANAEDRANLPRIRELRTNGLYRRLQLYQTIMGTLSYRGWHVVHGRLDTNNKQ